MSNCCVTGQPCTVEPCAKCPEHPIAEFHPWLDTYGTKAEYDRGDMAACWHAAQRALTATRTEAARTFEDLTKYRSGYWRDQILLIANGRKTVEEVAEAFNAALLSAVLSPHGTPYRMTAKFDTETREITGTIGDDSPPQVDR